MAPEVMAAAGLWEDIQLPARRQVQSLSVSRLSFSSYALKPYHPYAATIASTSCCHCTCRAAFLSGICAHCNSALCMAVAWSGHRCVLCSSTFNSIHASLSLMLQLTVCTVKTTWDMLNTSGTCHASMQVAWLLLDCSCLFEMCSCRNAGCGQSCCKIQASPCVQEV